MLVLLAKLMVLLIAVNVNSISEDFVWNIPANSRDGTIGGGRGGGARGLKPPYFKSTP